MLKSGVKKEVAENDIGQAVIVERETEFNFQLSDLSFRAHIPA